MTVSAHQRRHCGHSRRCKTGRAKLLAQLGPKAGDANRDERKPSFQRPNPAGYKSCLRWTTKMMTQAPPGTNALATGSRSVCRLAKRGAIKAALPQDAIISTDIGNNCAIGNAYPTFEQGRKYLAPGLFGPCGYGLPAILGAKIGCPDVPVVGFAGDGASVSP